MENLPGFIYILTSLKTGNHYIGSSNNPEKRLEEHNSGKTISTRNRGPWIISLVKEYSNIQEAKRIEFKIKQLKRRDYIERMIIEQDIWVR